METLKQIISKYNLEGDRPTRVGISRIGLASVFADLGFKVGAEIGVERALYSEALFLVIPDLHLHCVDPLRAYSGYREHVSQDKMDGFYEECLQRLQGKNYTFHRDFSTNVVHKIKDESLDFVYIDGNHDFQNTTNDIAEWSRKVRKGGILAGHDFNRNKKKDYACHVKDVVQAWTYSHDIKEWYVTTDRSPSWFWVKE